MKTNNISKNKEYGLRLLAKYDNDVILNINEKRLVSARELYLKLGFACNLFKNWSERHIVNSRLKNGIDYVICEYIPIKSNDSNQKHITNKRFIDYGLTIDVAKKICMKADTEIGDKIRDYFISVEKRYTSHLSYRANESLTPTSEKFLLNE